MNALKPDSGRVLAAMIVFVVMAVPGAWTAFAQTKFETVVVETSTGAHTFSAEVAQTPAIRRRGLMYRTSMPKTHGMLFAFGVDTEVSMWMRNTRISLDMVFIKADGRVHRIEANTTPFSERVIRAGAPVRAVLELNAGVAAKIGLKPQDRVVHRIFKTGAAR